MTVPERLCRRWHHMGVRLDLLEETEILQPCDNPFARGEALDLVQLFRQLGSTFGQTAQIVLIVDEGETALLVEQKTCGRPCRLPTFVFVEIMRRRDLDRARALSGSA